jgi:hypothetical protein
MKAIEEEKPRRNWERLAAIVVGAILLITGIIRNDFAIMALGAGSFGVPGISSMWKASNGSSTVKT